MFRLIHQLRVRHRLQWLLGGLAVLPLGSFYLGGLIHARHQYVVVLASLAVVLLATVALAWLLARSVLLPLSRLHVALGRIDAGERLASPPGSGTDEFTGLARALYDLSQFTSCISDRAFVDTLTQLPNRASFEQEVERRLSAARPFALMFANLDQFRTINDGYGHRFGDAVLRAAAARLLVLVGPRGRVFRCSADLFIVLLSTDVEHFATRVAAEAERLRHGMAELEQIENHQLPLCASFGVALFPDDGSHLEALVSAADTALFHAKRLGRNTVQFSRDDCALTARHRLELAEDLRSAIIKGTITPYFQPIVDLGLGEVVCAEALARWQHPTRGFVPPEEFIAVAEDSGQIDALTDLLMRRACTVAAGWRCSGEPRKLAFNLSARQVRPGIVEMIQRVLQDTGLAASRLEIEITETSMIERPELAARLLHELRGIGVGVALDDFGTSYSSLTYLLRFPIDKIKVDKTFVSQLERQRQAGKIVAATITLAANLEIALVAEGVERLSQMLTLYQLGCRQQQGWLFAKALPAAEFDQWLLTAPLSMDAIVHAQKAAANDPLSRDFGNSR